MVGAGDRAGEALWLRDSLCASKNMEPCKRYTFRQRPAQVTGLARVLRLRDALCAIDSVRRRGVPPGDEVPFGVVINSPLALGAPLVVVQPHDGSQARLVSVRITTYLIMHVIVDSVHAPGVPLALAQPHGRSQARLDLQGNMPPSINAHLCYCAARVWCSACPCNAKKWL